MAFYRYNGTTGKLVPITSDGSIGLPVGAVQGFALGTQSPNWLLCDGRDTTGTAEELQTKYPALYTYLGNSNVLPDYRECVLVGVGQNDTDTIASHDVYTLGEFKDDQLQDHKHNAQLYWATAMGSNHPGYGGNGRWESGNIRVNGVKDARYGTTTHGKQKGIAYYIKATSAGIEVDRGLYATKGYVNDAVSYSTDEQLTGGKWIDGKPIYRKVWTGTYNAGRYTDILPEGLIMISITGYIKYSQDGGTRYWVVNAPQNRSNDIYFASVWYNSAGFVQLEAQGPFEGNDSAIIFEYAKATD